MKSILTLLGLLLIQSCSTAVVRVLPGEDGLHTVISRDIEQDGAEEEAVEAAKKYCDEKQMAGSSNGFCKDGKSRA